MARLTRRSPLAALYTTRPRRRSRRAWLRWVFGFAAGAVVIAGAWLLLKRPPPDRAMPGSATAASPLPADSAALSDDAQPVVPITTTDTPATSPAPASAPPAATPAPPATATAEEENFHPRPARDVLEAQIALMRDAICPGSIDGAWGGQTRAAIIAFQQKHGLRVTGQLDNATREKLELRETPLTSYTVTADDVARLRSFPKGWVERAALDRLDFASVLELVAEKHATNPNLVRKLNPGIDWNAVAAGAVVRVPRVTRAAPTMLPARIVIHLAEKNLQVFDAESRLLAHFPCSIARRVEKRPVGELEVVNAAKNPNYTFNPETFPDSAEAQRIGRKLILQPGPNNPVGVAWISLSLPGYGIHGTPEPEQIGRTESSGCFRLANWNAEYLLPLVRPGLPVQVEP